MPLLTQDPNDPRFLSQYAGGDITGTMTGPTGPATPPTPVVPTPPAPPQYPGNGQFSSNMNPSTFSSIMDTMRNASQKNNDLAQLRAKLVSHLYDQPLTDAEMQGMDPAMQNALKSGDRRMIEMQLRLVNDEIQGRTTSLDKSVQYLTEGYNADLTRMDNQKSQALDQIKSFLTLYKDDPAMASKVISNLYSPEVEAALKANGLDIEGLAAQVKAGTTDTPTLIGETIADTHNNPGNIKVPAGGIEEARIRYGDPGATVGSDAKDGGQFIKFSNSDAGWKAMQTLLKMPSYADITLDQAMKRWSNNGYGADVAPNLDPMGKIKDFTPDQMDYLTKQMAAREGFGAAKGNGYDLSNLSTDEQTQHTGKTPEQQKAYLNLTANERSAVQQLLDGSVLISDLPGFSGAAAKMRILEEARKIDPTFNENTMKLRYAFRKRWETGDLWDNRTSVNTAMGHMADLAESAAALDNKTIQKYNTIKNLYNKETGDPAIVSFKMNVDLLAAELAKIYKGGKSAPTDQETALMRESIMANLSPAQFSALFDKASQLLSSRLASLTQGYKGTMGVSPGDIIDPWVRNRLVSQGINPDKIESGTPETLSEKVDALGYDYEKMSKEMSDAEILKAFKDQGIDLSTQ